MAEQPDDKAAAAPTTQRQVIERTVVREVTEPDNGPNMATDPDDPEKHYYRIPDGEGRFRRINAWGEEKGSPEDKKRW